MNTNLLFIFYRLLLDSVGMVVLIFVVYVFTVLIRRLMLERWITKAVNAAESMFPSNGYSKENSVAKKEWVLKFLKDNGLTQGISDSMVDALVEAEVNSIKIKKIER